MQEFASISDTSSELANSETSGPATNPARLTYERGNVLTLRAHNLGERSIEVRIVRVYRPSCVMSVVISDGSADSGNVPSRAVLKLYDRRCSESLRNEHGVDPWDTGVEDAFMDFVSSGAAAEFMNTLQDSEYLAEPESGWNSAESETYLQWWCLGLRDSEIEAYRHLKALQGRQIPKLFSSVTLTPSAQPAAILSPSNRTAPLLQIPGILMEHIVGHTLEQMPDFVLPEHWQVTVDEAINVVHALSDSGAMNENIRPKNFIASSSNGRYRVVMTDLSRSVLRQSHQSDEEWSKLKAEVDEEGTIGRSMTTILSRVGFNLRYVPSGRFG